MLLDGGFLGQQNGVIRYPKPKNSSSHGGVPSAVMAIPSFVGLMNIYSNGTHGHFAVMCAPSLGSIGRTALRVCISWYLRSYTSNSSLSSIKH